jgi:competence protein ComEA
LPGVGPALAARIIEYRESAGSFSDVRELREVSGIGEKMFAKIKDLVTL